MTSVGQPLTPICVAFRTLYWLLKKFENEKEILIFKGLGKVFTSGGDVKQIASLPQKILSDGYSNSNRASDLIANYKVPYVALMDGLALGGASFYSLPGRYCVATERTVYAMPETAIGELFSFPISIFIESYQTIF